VNLFTAHWELKLVAIVLASALWIYTSGQVRSDRTLDVQIRPENVSGLGDNYQIRDISPAQFRVTLSVPSSRWGDLPANDLITPRLQVRTDQKDGSREQTFSVTSTLLGLPSDIRIVRTEPENLRELAVRWDVMDEGEFPAEAPALANVPSGLEAEVRLDINVVRVRAAAGILDRERRQKSTVRFQPLDLGFAQANAPGEQQRRAELIPVPGMPFKVLRTPVATITLRPIPAAVLVPSVAVQALVGRDALGHATIEVAPAQVSLTVRGPENLLRELKPENDITAYVDLRRLQPGDPVEVPLALLAPSWLSFDAQSVRVTITPVQDKPENGGGAEAHPTPQPAPAPAPAPAPEGTGVGPLSPLPVAGPPLPPNRAGP
jgi:hypothetical protein